MNKFFQIADNLKPAAQEIVGNTVQDLSEVVKQNAPADTEFMQDSVYYVTPLGETTYGQASPDRAGSYLLEQAEPEHDLQVGSSRVDLQACKLEYSIVSPK